MKRPFQVTILGCLFIIAGLVGLGYHLSERPLEPWVILISGIRIIAVVGGAFLLLGHGWARWLMLAWLALHVVVSAFHSLSDSAAHVVLLVFPARVVCFPVFSVRAITEMPSDDSRKRIARRRIRSYPILAVVLHTSRSR
jgi:hypothetical protein